MKSTISSICEIWINVTTCAKKDRCHLLCFIFLRILQNTKQNRKKITELEEKKIILLEIDC